MKKIKFIFNAVAQTVYAHDTYTHVENEHAVSVKRRRLLIFQTVSSKYSSRGIVKNDALSSALGTPLGLNEDFENEKKKAAAFCKTGHLPKN